VIDQEGCEQCNVVSWHQFYMDHGKVNKMVSSVLRYSNCQAMLPATGAPVSRQRASKMREMFDEYVRIRTLENWKFWIVSFMSLQIRFGGQQYIQHCVYHFVHFESSS
jgi:hypothetical protein